jgi:hypothetical protein
MTKKDKLAFTLIVVLSSLLTAAFVAKDGDYALVSLACILFLLLGWILIGDPDDR